MDAGRGSILVVGGGALGTLLATRWRDGGRDVTILARGVRRDRLAAAGWNVVAAGEKATRRFALIVVATRGYDVAGAAADALPFANPAAVVAVASRDDAAAAELVPAFAGRVCTLGWDGHVATPPASRPEIRHDAREITLGFEREADWSDRLRLEAAAASLSVPGFPCRVVEDAARRRRTRLLQWLLTECTAALLHVSPAVACGDPEHAPAHAALVADLRRLAWRGRLAVDGSWAECWRSFVLAGAAPAHSHTLDDLRAWRALELPWALDSIGAVDASTTLGLSRHAARLYHAERHRRLGLRPPRGRVPLLAAAVERPYLPHAGVDCNPGSHT